MIGHTTNVRVRYRDTDQMGVVYHGVYLEFFETGRTELLRTCGMAYSNIERGGLLLPVLEATLQIQRPARYDELIAVTATMHEPTGIRLLIQYQIHRGDLLLVSGSTTHVFTTADGMKPVRPPAGFLEVLRQGNQSAS
ncbi:MAG: acyl-CoA thioesterase [Chlorobi bacterium]|jgi:acyl-CoA thioester hydrolase|nr:acyl-CoA thioesterase [Chlorobiota bacterium]